MKETITTAVVPSTPPGVTSEQRLEDYRKNADLDAALDASASYIKREYGKATRKNIKEFCAALESDLVQLFLVMQDGRLEDE